MLLSKEEKFILHKIAVAERHGYKLTAGQGFIDKHRKTVCPMGAAGLDPFVPLPNGTTGRAAARLHRSEGWVYAFGGCFDLGYFSGMQPRKHAFNAIPMDFAQRGGRGLGLLFGRAFAAYKKVRQDKRPPFGWFYAAFRARELK